MSSDDISSSAFFVQYAVTRGKQLVVLVGQAKAINIAIHNDKTDLRYTHLAARVRETGHPQRPGGA